MTGPAMDWSAWFNGSDPRRQQEFDKTYAGVMDFYNRFSKVVAGPEGQQVPTAQIPPHEAWTDEDLVGAAQYWGMSEDAARALPRDVIQKFVQEHRDFAKQSGTSTVANVLAPLAQFGVGAAEGITGTLLKLPGIGDWLNRGGTVREADQYFRQLEEGIRSSTADGSMQTVESGFNVAGNVAALWYPSTAAWAVAGKVGKIVPMVSRLSPIGRAAVQGGLSAYMLEGGTQSPLETQYGQVGGTQDPWAHRAEVFGGGAVLGAAIQAVQPAIAKLATKVAQQFGVGDLRMPADLRGDASQPPGPPGMATLPSGPQPITDPGRILPEGDLGKLMRLAQSGDQQAQEILKTIQPKQDFGYYPMGPISEEVSPRPLIGLDIAGEGGYQRQPDFSPQVGLRPERTPLNPDGGYGPEGSFMQPDVGRMRGPDNMPRVGTRPERINPFAPEVGTDEPGLLQAIRDNKVGTIVQAPDFPTIAAQPQLGDVSVAQAAQSQNPGGTNVVQGITDPQSLVRSYGKNLRFINKDGRLDALLSDEPIPDAAAEEYQQFGLFTGQKVLTEQGMEARIRGIMPNKQALLELRSGPLRSPDWISSLSELHPWITSPSVREVPELWDSFQGFSQQKAAEIQSMMGGGMSPQNLATVYNKNQAFWMEDFFKEAGIHNPGDQSRIREYFNQRWVDSFRDLAPTHNVQQSIAVADAVTTPSAISPVGALDQAAAVKGFMVEPQGGDKWTLRTAGSNISFESRGAAETYVKQLNRELPDVTPDSSVPLEVSAMHPTGAPQPSNENADLLERTAEAVSDVEAEIGQPPAGHGPPQVDAAQGNYAKLHSRLQAARSWWSPLRRKAALLDQALYESGRTDMGLASDVDKMQVTQNLYHTEMGPYQNHLTDILAPVSTHRLYSGEWTQVYEETDPLKQAALTKRLGWSPKEVQSLTDYENLMKAMFPNTGLDEIRQIPQYISHIAARQSNEATRLTAFDNFPLGPTTKPYWEMMRTGNLNHRELDPRVLGDSYIRSVFWQKHMAEPFEELKSKWQGVARDDPAVEPASSAMLDWLHVMKNGYDLKDDFVVNAAHEVLKTLVDPAISRSQAKEVVLGGLNSAYAGMIGYRPNMIARHFLQMTYALPRVGDELPATLGRFMSSAEARSDIMNEAIRDGAISPRSFTRAAPGDFTGELERAGGGDAGPNAVEHTARFNLAAKLYGTLRDAMPDALKGSSDALWQPMGAFSHAVERFRSIVYVSGKNKAAGAIAAFRAAGEKGDLAKLMDDSMMSSFSPAWQREFQNLLGTSDEEAAKFAARQLSNATFFNYGAANGPDATKSVTGRIGWQLGIYPMNYLAMVKEVLETKNPSVITKHLMGMATTTAALYGASRATGWALNWLNPWAAIGWGTGPLVDAAAAASQGFQKVRRGIAEGQDDQLQQGLTGLRNTGVSLAAGLTPIGGLVAGAKDFQAIGQSQAPAQAAVEWGLTGQVHPSEGIWTSQADPMFQQQLQPYQSPLRGQPVQGLPPSQTMQQQVVDPPLVQDPRLLYQLTAPTTGSTQPTNGLPTPGGTEVFPRGVPQR